MIAIQLSCLLVAALCATWLYRECRRLHGRNIVLGLDAVELRRELADVQSQRDSLFIIAKTMGAIVKQQGNDIDMLLSSGGWELPQQDQREN